MTKVQENSIQTDFKTISYKKDIVIEERSLSPFLDKLAQPHTDGPKKFKRNIDSLKKRARAKYISRH
jgi:hypothetical protein